MKVHYLHLLYRYFRSNPKAGRNVAITFGVMFSFLLIIGGAVIWGVLSVASEIFTRVQTSTEIDSARDRIEEVVTNQLPDFAIESCAKKFVELSNPLIWLEQPFFDNVKAIKIACLEQGAEICEASVACRSEGLNDELAI